MWTKIRSLMPKSVKYIARGVERSTWWQRRTLVKRAATLAKAARNYGRDRKGSGLPTAGMIFSRFHLEYEQQRRAGTGRMQHEAGQCLQNLGFKTFFAGQEDKYLSRDIVQSDIIVAFVGGLVKLPFSCVAKTLLYTANTHIKEKQQRLIASAEKWNLPNEISHKEDIFLRAYRMADYLLIAENDDGVRNFTTRRIPLSKIRRYNNCVDVDIWMPTRNKRNTLTFVCYSSALGLRKGLPVLVAAWRKWASSTAAELHVIGTPTPVSDILFNGLRHGEVSRGLHIDLDEFPSQHEPIINFVGSCHIGVLPTLEDAQPSSLLEMASCGLPVITTIESGVDFPTSMCQYIKMDDPDSLSSAFEFWASHYSDIPDASHIARNYIVENHSWPCFRRRFTAIISEVCDLHS